MLQFIGRVIAKIKLFKKKKRKEKRTTIVYIDTNKTGHFKRGH